ncbi:MAG: hypothetical protein EA382_03855 [Spirochaetaceae bacterium]|nr:MAG: hypothetical protein EA382_03855 [Spirochaetaceae bacterium]
MRRVLPALLLLIVGVTLSAQELVFFDGVVRVYERIDGELFELQDSRDDRIAFGFQLDSNFVVRTGSGFAEILLPNGHILKLDSNTEIYLDTVLARGASSGNDVVAVRSGRVRSVVANISGTGRGFQVRTPTAVGGVRGTDFLTQVLSGEETIAVQSGVVEFVNDQGTSLSLGANQFANALAATFAATQSQDVAQQFYGALNQLSDQIQQAQANAISQLAPPPAEEPAEPDADDPPLADPGATPPVVVEPTPAPAPSQPESDEPGAFDTFMIGLTDALGLEIGSLTLDGATYSKLIAQPVFRIGRLRAGLYLPIIYSGNLFDSEDWYRPKGNNEWSFGTDQDWRNDPLAGITDLVGDLALKIRFLEFGRQRDPFFLKVGNLSGLQLGHGLLLRDYANDADFPSIRRIGFNIGIDGGGAGFEALVNDLAAPELFGARLYARPIPIIPLAVGVSGVADIGPARDLPDTEDVGIQDVRTADPIFLNVALDLDLPIIERDLLSIILYGDIGGLLPYLRQPAGGLESGFHFSALTAPAEGTAGLRNYGIASGVMGNIALLDYRLEFQNYHGFFRPAFYGRSYDRVRGERAREVISYLQDPDAPEFQNQTVAIYGEAGFTIAEAVQLRAGYRWPWTTDPVTNEIVVGDDDYLLASLSLRKGLLPLGISAGFSYERSYFVPTLLTRDGFESARLFDENTVLSGEIVYPIAPIMDVVASVSTVLLRDGEGNIVYEERNGQLRPKFGPVISITTRIGGSSF